MKNIFQSQYFKTLLPYFTLAVMIIIAFRIIHEVEIFFNFAGQIWRIIKPFFYGFLLAYCLSIPCGGIEKLMGRIKNKFIIKRKKAISVVLIYILFFFTIYLIFNLIIPSIVDSIRYFFNNYYMYYDSFQYMIGLINEVDIFPEITMGMDDLLAMLPEFNLANLSTPMNMLFGVGSAIFTGFLAFVSSVYILFEKEDFKAFLCRLLKAITSSDAYNFTLKYSRRLNHNFKQYIYTQTIDGLILGTVATLELRFIIKSEYFLLLGVMLGILNYIPYFGSIVGSLIAVLVVTLTQGMTAGLITLAVLLVTQQLDGNVLQPKLMGGSFALSPLLVIISITIGGAFAGALGMIAAIPIVAVLKDMLESIMQYYEQKKQGYLNVGRDHDE